MKTDTAKSDGMTGWKLLFLVVLSVGGLAAWSYWDPTAVHRSMPSEQSTLYPIDLRGYDAGPRVLLDAGHNADAGEPGADAEAPDAQVLLDVDGVLSALRIIANVEAPQVAIGAGGYTCRGLDGGAIECGEHSETVQPTTRKMVLASSEGEPFLEAGWYDVGTLQRTVLIDSSGNATFNAVVTAAGVTASSTITGASLQTSTTETGATGYAWLPCPSIDAGTGYAPLPSACTTNTEGLLCVSRNAIWRCGTGSGCDGGAAGGCWLPVGL